MITNQVLYQLSYSSVPGTCTEAVPGANRLGASVSRRILCAAADYRRPPGMEQTAQRLRNAGLRLSMKAAIPSF